MAHMEQCFSLGDRWCCSNCSIVSDKHRYLAPGCESQGLTEGDYHQLCFCYFSAEMSTVELIFLWLQLPETFRSRLLKIPKSIPFSPGLSDQVCISLYGHSFLLTLLSPALGVPITEPEYFSRMSLEQLRHVLRSDNTTPMPMLEERHQVRPTTATHVTQTTRYTTGVLLRARRHWKPAERFLLSRRVNHYLPYCHSLDSLSITQLKNCQSLNSISVNHSSHSLGFLTVTARLLLVWVVSLFLVGLYCIIF